jgi:hypothetical protein
MCRQFKCHDNNGRRERGNSNNPHIRVVSLFIHHPTVDRVNAEQENHDRFNYALSDPEEIVGVVEDCVLLADEIYFREEAVQEFVYL